jgi:hypothetical protein
MRAAWQALDGASEGGENHFTRFICRIGQPPPRNQVFPMPKSSAKVRTFGHRLADQASGLTMTTPNSDPLHGVTLEQILKALVEHYEWSGLAERIDIRCFKSDPSIKSSLTFLRKTPWAREKVESLYVKLHRSKGW